MNSVKKLNCLDLYSSSLIRLIKSENSVDESLIQEILIFFYEDYSKF